MKNSKKNALTSGNLQFSWSTDIGLLEKLSVDGVIWRRSKDAFKQEFQRKLTVNPL